ncbi:MAG: amino acid--tRNA ligase-related protein, partial [Terracidiphilus sp.]
GVSTQHNPEFTMLEFYQAYANYHDLMDLTEELIKFLAMEVNGTTVTHFPVPRGSHVDEVVKIDLEKWRRMSIPEAIVEFWPGDLGPGPSVVEIKRSIRDVLTRAVQWLNPKYPDWISETERILPVTNFDSVTLPGEEPKFVSIATQRKIHAFAIWLDEIDQGKPEGRVIYDLFEILADDQSLMQPTIIYEFPTAVSPLSKQKPDEPDWVERFEVYIGGFEIGNAFSELNDPVEQHKRFEQQLAERFRGDEEAHQMDEDYVRALAYGLPPTAGEGIGIDRLVMLLTGSKSIRDVILFPLMRGRDQRSEIRIQGSGIGDRRAKGASSGEKQPQILRLRRLPKRKRLRSG